MKKEVPKKAVFGVAAAALVLLLLSAAALAVGGETTGKTPEAGGNTEFTFSDSGIAAVNGSAAGYQISGTELTIQKSGTYLVSGSCADGSIEIAKGTTDVTLILSGLTLTSSDTAPIVCGKSTEVTIVAAGGTTNTLTDSEKNNDESYPDNENAENAVIKCKDGSCVTICGSGTLTIDAQGKNGIKSGASTGEEGEASLTIQDVTLHIDAPVNDAINAEQQLSIESGILTISAADDAIHSDYEMTIGATDAVGPTITITDCYEGIEAAELTILSGDIDITASDDCLNAANSDLTDYDFSMTISGGTINAYSADGDGFDSNGSLTISGGTVSVWTANTADNQPLDADGTLTISGGTVLAAGGSAGMGVRISTEQGYVSYGSTGGMGGGPMGAGGGTALISGGSDFAVQDSSGNAIYSGTAVCNASYVFFSSPELVSGDSYDWYSGTDSVASAAAQTGTAESKGMGGGQRPDNGNGQQLPMAPEETDGQPPVKPDDAGDRKRPLGDRPAPNGENADTSSDG